MTDKHTIIEIQRLTERLNDIQTSRETDRWNKIRVLDIPKTNKITDRIKYKLTYRQNLKIIIKQMD